MRTRLLLASILLLVLSGCQLSLVAFLVPAVVQIDQVFELEARVSATSVQGEGGVVLQLPLGFTVQNVIPVSVGMVRDDPALLALYTAEPGHFLASWSLGQSTINSGEPYRVYVRAPSTTSIVTIKLALAGRPLSQAWQANVPAAITNFAQITALPNAQPLVVADYPVFDYAIDAAGLPFATELFPHWGVDLADLDGDGDDDLLAPGRAFYRSGSAWFENSNGLLPAAQRERVAAGDFNGDGRVDLVWGGGLVHFGAIGGGFVAGPRLTGSVATFGASTGDVNGDGYDDIALAGFDRHLNVYLGGASGTFPLASNGLPAQPAIAGLEVLLHDVTGDGHLDLVWNEVWAGDGQGNWSLSTGFPPNVASGVAQGDLDGDGQPEVVLANDTAGVGIHRHLGNNTWTQVLAIAPLFRSVRAIAVLDFDRDGQNDLALGYRDPTGGIEIWRNLGGFSFQRLVDTGLPLSTPTFVEDLDVGDVNGDGWPDLAAAFAGQGIAVYQNWRTGVAPFGESCSAPTMPLLAIGATAPPQLGDASFAVRLSGGTPFGFGLVWIGGRADAWSGVALPIDLASIGAPSCDLLTGFDSVGSGSFDASGVFTLHLPIPAIPALRKATAFAQGAALSPSANALGFVFTNGLALRIN